MKREAEPLLWLVKHNPNQTPHPVLLADNSLMHLGIRWTDELGQEFSGPLIGKKVRSMLSAFLEQS